MDYGPLLKTLLYELKDGVIVCEAGGRITLFNRAAEDLFGGTPGFGREKSLYDFCFRPPVESALELLRFQQEPGSVQEPLSYVQFMTAASDRRRYFRCRISFLAAAAAPLKAFVIIFEDISAWHSPANPLFLKIEEFRAPMTNLRAAVENLTEYPEMSPVMRSAFENVLVQESLNLSEAFDALARSCTALMQSRTYLSDLNTGVLFGYVAEYLGDRKITVTVTADRTVGVRVDVYGLLLVLEHLAAGIQQKLKPPGVSCEAHAGEHFIYFDLVWSGSYMSSASVEKMLQEKPPQSVGDMSLAAIIRSMDGDIWSQRQEASKGMLRLALPIAAEAAS